MKKISVLVPTYNEEANVAALAGEIEQIFAHKLAGYDYELVFIDNASKDGTRTILRELCAGNKKIRAVFNARNFGQFNSPYYGLMQTGGDCTVLMCADFQDPPEMIVSFVREWEKGYRIVIGVKTKSKENPFIYFLRTCYYRMIKKLSDVEQIEHFTGFGLYDKSFIAVLKELRDPMPFLRGIVAELGYERKEVPYEQQLRQGGRTSNNWYSLYDAAMLGFTSYTKIGLRLATFLGFFCSGVSILVAFVYLVLKLLHWEQFAAGNVPILLCVCVFGSVQMFFTGLLGEYVLSINARILARPLVVEEERINFEDQGMPSVKKGGFKSEQDMCDLREKNKAVQQGRF